MIWNREYECMSRDRLLEVQTTKLSWMMKWVYDKVPFYKQAFNDAGLSPKDIKTPDDLQKLPFTTKDDLRDNYPFGMFAMPLEEVVRVHASSGTTGKPIVVGYTKGDLSTWAELTARIATAGGMTSRDVVQVAFGYGLFTGGFGMHAGSERIGATLIPASSGNTKRQVTLMKDFGTTALICTPSYALYISEVMREMGISPDDLKLRIGLFGSEPCSEGMRTELENRLGIIATDNYGLTEIIGPGVAGECQEKNGLHINEDHFIVEVIDSETGEVLPEGETGELVFTTLTKEAFPVIRYRTRDISRITTEPCICGRTLGRMSKVLARTDDMLIIKGVNVFPSQIESVLLKIEGVEPQYQIIVDREGGMDQVEVQVEVEEINFPDSMKELVSFQQHIHDEIYAVLGLRVKVKLVEPKTIERTAGKTRRVIDNRSL